MAAITEIDSGSSVQRCGGPQDAVAQPSACRVAGSGLARQQGLLVARAYFVSPGYQEALFMYHSHLVHPISNLVREASSLIGKRVASYSRD
ncbi:hypothetical protein [Streptomyces platensis]|uniref:hypothetical protein n=1 Tax=Streptomyces platensis TaxID=58346 RepID=UPI00117C4C87|nr:hypothetical protein [Streptomyces platensis]